MGEIVNRVPNGKDELKKPQVETDEEVLRRYLARAEMGCLIPTSDELARLIKENWRSHI